MIDEPDIDDELGPDEHELVDRLGAQRPVPAAGFRGALGRHLAARDPGYGPRPERLRLIVAGYLGVGSLLIAVGTLAGVLSASAMAASRMAISSRFSPNADAELPSRPVSPDHGSISPMLDARCVALGALLSLPAALTAYFAFNSGGFYPGPPAYVAIVLCVALLLRVTLAANPFEGFSRSLAWAPGALASYAVLTLVSASWSHAPRRALVSSTCRSSTYWRWCCSGLSPIPESAWNGCFGCWLRDRRRLRLRADHALVAPCLAHYAGACRQSPEFSGDLLERAWAACSAGDRPLRALLQRAS